MVARSLERSAGLRRSISRARSVQVSRAGRAWFAFRWASPSWNRTAKRSAPSRYSLRYCSKFSIARGAVLARQAGSAHGEEQPGAERRAFGELACLGQQLVGGIGVGWNQGVVGLEQSLSKALVNTGELVFAVTGQQADGLVASQLLGGGPVAGGQLDARQLEPELGGPPAGGAGAQSLTQVFPGRVALAREALGDRLQISIVRAGIAVLGVGREGDQSSACGLVLAPLEGRDHLRGHDGRDRLDRGLGRRTRGRGGLGISPCRGKDGAKCAEHDDPARIANDPAPVSWHHDSAS